MGKRIARAILENFPTSCRCVTATGEWLGFSSAPLVRDKFDWHPEKQGGVHPYLTSELRGVGVVIIALQGEKQAWEDGSQYAFFVAEELAARGASICLVLANCVGECAERIIRRINAAAVSGAGKKRACQILSIDNGELNQNLFSEIVFPGGQVHVVLNFRDSDVAPLTTPTTEQSIINLLFDRKILKFACPATRILTMLGETRILPSASNRTTEQELNTDMEYALSLQRRYPDILSLVCYAGVGWKTCCSVVACGKHRSCDARADAVVAWVLRPRESLDPSFLHHNLFGPIDFGWKRRKVKIS